MLLLFLIPVPSLQAMCRVAILERIDKKEVTKLPLPNALKRYLTYTGNVDNVRGNEVGDVHENDDDDNDDASGGGGGGGDNGDASGNGGGGDHG
jgi:hypothetical protein